MVKHTQTIRRQFADELFESFWPFCKTGTLKVNKNVSTYIVVKKMLLQILGPSVGKS